MTQGQAQKQKSTAGDSELSKAIHGRLWLLDVIAVLFICCIGAMAAYFTIRTCKEGGCIEVKEETSRLTQNAQQAGIGPNVELEARTQHRDNESDSSLPDDKQEGTMSRRSVIVGEPAEEKTSSGEISRNFLQVYSAEKAPEVL